jgi:hypothetical protein
VLAMYEEYGKKHVVINSTTGAQVASMACFMY